MKALFMLLHNLTTNTYHPIMYFESPLPGDGNEKLVRYKSKGHHTEGFVNRQDAVDSILNDKNEEKLKSIGYTMTNQIDTSPDIEWDGKELPLDVQIRNRN